MTIRSLTYTDIPLARRTDSASKARMRLQERLSDHSLNESQRSDLMAQLERLNKWFETEGSDNG